MGTAKRWNDVVRLEAKISDNVTHPAALALGEPLEHVVYIIPVKGCGVGKVDTRPAYVKQQAISAVIVAECTDEVDALVIEAPGSAEWTQDPDAIAFAVAHEARIGPDNASAIRARKPALARKGLEDAENDLLRRAHVSAVPKLHQCIDDGVAI